jgi:hypothetical protein
VAETTVIDVLANPPREISGSSPRDTSTLEITISEYATCPGRKHPLLTLTPGHAPDVECNAVNAVMANHRTPLYRPLRSWEDAIINGESFKLVHLLRWFWGAIDEDQLGSVYALVDTCGTRNAGTIVGPAELPIRIFPVESYSISLSIPPLWSGKREESKLFKISGGAQNSSMVDKTQWRREVSVSQENKFAFLDKSSSGRSTTTQERKLFGT